jgi:flagellar basal body-associated protein FliL
MAEEEVQVAEATPEEAGGGGDKTNSVVMILIVLSVLVMILTPLTTVFLVKSMAPKPKEIEQDKNKTTEVVLEKIQVNLAGTNATRFARIDVALKVSDSSMVLFFMTQENDPEHGMLNEIKAEIRGVIGDNTVANLESRESKKNLADDIKKVLNDLLSKRTEGTVTKVYFPDFLIQ